MILTDFSSNIHRMIYAGVSQTNPVIQEDGKFLTSDFIGLTMHYILNELFDVTTEFSNEYGNMVICLDDGKDGYWRKDVYYNYKMNRKKAKNISNVNFPEVFNEVNKLIEAIRKYLPWKVISVKRTEADDVMLALAREYNKSEKVLILSPDKDMIQAQRNTNNVFQYSKLTKKWLKPESKAGNMNDWITEHVCLGDACDEVPKVVDHTEFSLSFITHLRNNHIMISTPQEFKELALHNSKKNEIIKSFSLYKMNRKGESTGILDIYKDMRFGPATLKKQILKHGSMDKWLDSNSLYRKHYERNYKLVMEEGIPKDIWDQIIINYENAETVYDNVNFEAFLNNNNLKSSIIKLPNVFKIDHELTASDFNW